VDNRKADKAVINIKFNLHREIKAVGRNIGG